MISVSLLFFFYWYSNVSPFADSNCSSSCVDNNLSRFSAISQKRYPFWILNVIGLVLWYLHDRNTQWVPNYQFYIQSLQVIIKKDAKIVFYKSPFVCIYVLLFHNRKHVNLIHGGHWTRTNRHLIRKGSGRPQFFL